MAKVNKKKCIGCGLCVSIAPETFFMDDDGKAKAKTTGNPKKIKEAIESCPEGAITE